MRTEKQIHAEFLKHVEKHTVEILRDDGLYRHIRCTEGGSWHHWFEIVTWPNGLIINGDMETWAFSRVEDMFTFFRRGAKPNNFNDDDINPIYWSEKLLTDNKRTAAREFDHDEFKKQVVEHLDEIAEHSSPSFSKKREAILEALEEDVFSVGEYQSESYTALHDFEHDGFRFEDFYHLDGMVWKYHFIWCLYAIVWTINQYDAQKQKKQEAA